MPILELHREQQIHRPLAEVFDFFASAENLERITPPWLRFRILEPAPDELKQGATIDYALRVHGIPIRWTSRIERWNPPFEFIDVQVKGPYKRWRHLHRFSETNGGTLMEDLVEYELPFGPLGRLAHRLQVARDLERIFDYRTRRIEELLTRNGPALTPA